VTRRRLRVFWPFRHFGLKVLSLGLALLLWVTVAGEQTVERGLRVPLEFQQFPAGLELQGEIPATVDVRVRGTSGALSRVSPGDVVAVLDLRGARPGQRLFHLTPEQVRTPFGVEPLQVRPPSLVMTFDTSTSKSVPIVPMLDGRPAPGFMVSKWRVEPESIEIVGPRSAVAKVTQALTEPVDLSDTREPLNETVAVGLVDPAVRLKTPRPAAVSVQIVPAPIEHKLRAQPVHLRNLATNLTAEAMPATVDVTIRGTRDALSHVEPDDIAAFVDLAGLGAGQYALTVRADPSREAGVTHVDPSSVQVRIFRDKK